MEIRKKKNHVQALKDENRVWVIGNACSEEIVIKIYKNLFQDT